MLTTDGAPGASSAAAAGSTVGSILEDVIRRRLAGEQIDDDAVLAAHPHMALELRSQLAALQRIELARELGSIAERTAVRTVAAPTVVDASLPTIPGYRELRELDRGGQGIVYQAVQEGTQRPVAIKVLLDGRYESRAARLRFEREIELAASLDHRNTVTILHSGTLPDNRLFCVMDYVRGVPLHRYVALHLLARDAILQLFLKVCDAISYAHQRGVIHRDLKPSNILVDDAGEPHVLDFGLAKSSIAPAVAGEEAELLTLSGQFVGTPAYAAPEQIQGRVQSIDVRTDVYALGILLYQALSGQLPFDPAQPLGRLLQEIEHREPRPPSTLNSKLDRDLDAIVLRALEKLPAQRYQSVDTLREDVRRYLDGEPIEARRHSVVYLWRKRLRRHRVAFSVAAGFLLLLCGATAVSTMLYLRAEAARRESDVRAYISAIAGASSALGSSNVLAARNCLDSVPPALRNWEWNYLAGRLDESTRTFETQSTVYGLDFHPTQPLLAAGCRDGSVHAWNADTGEKLTRFDAGAGLIQDLRFSPDGRFLAVGGYHEMTRLYHPDSWELIATLPCQGPVLTVCFSADGLLLATATERVVCLWELSNAGDSRSEWTPRRVIQAPLSLRGIALDNDGAALVGFGERGIWRWSLDDAEQPKVFSPDANIAFSMALAPRDDAVFVSLNDGTIQKRPLHGDGPVLNLHGHHVPPMGMDLSPDGATLLSVSWDLTVRQWDARSGKLLRTFVGHGANPQRVCFAPRAAHFATGDMAGHVKLWSVSDPAVADDWANQGRVVRLATWPGRPYLLAIRGVTSDDGGMVALWDTATRRPVAELYRNVFEVPHAGGKFWHILSLDTSATGAWAAADAGDGSVLVWSAADLERALHAASGGQSSGGPVALRLRPNDESLPLVARLSHALAFSGDERWLFAAGHRRQEIWRWDLRTQRFSGVLAGHKAGVTALAADPRGPRIASGDRDNTIRLWNSETLAPLGVLTGHKDDITELAFCPNANQLASSGRDGAARLWDLQTGREIVTYLGHSGPVMALAFSPDGTRLATGGEDRTVRIWDAQTGQELAVLYGHSYFISSLVFCGDGALLVSGSADGTIRFWDSRRGAAAQR